jgi:MFS-type transporter involved in bile tolerance (Atg22 family)
MKLVANIVGALGAILYVGYFAYKVGETPLSIIVVISLALMVYAFIDDTRRDRAVTEARREQDRPD